jgi:hypothetical protein
VEFKNTESFRVVEHAVAVSPQIAVPGSFHSGEPLQTSYGQYLYSKVFQEKNCAD